MNHTKMDINNMRVIDQSGNSVMLGYYEKEGGGHIVINDFDIRMEDFNRYVDSIMGSSLREGENANANAGENLIKVELVERLINTAVCSSAFTAFVIFSISIWTFQLVNSIHNLSCV